MFPVSVQKFSGKKVFERLTIMNWRWWIVYVVWLTDERLLSLFPVETSPSRISDTPPAGFEPAQNLSLDFAEWSCAVVITAAPRRYRSTI